MTVDNFNPQEFSNSLLAQVQNALPQNFNEELKNYIVSKVNQFCTMAGNALVQDPSLKLTNNQAGFICQFIAEYTFKKSIQLVSFQIPTDHWENLLQQVAFIVFEVGKKTQINNMNNQESAQVISQEFAAAFKNTLQEYVKAGIITEEVSEKMAENQDSNQQQQVEQDQQEQKTDKQEEEEPVPQKKPLSDKEQKKNIKLASIAVLLRQLSQERAQSILKVMDPQEAQQIEEYMKIPDLERQINPDVCVQFLNDFKKKLKVTKKTVRFNPEEITKMLELFSTKEIKQAVEEERKGVKDFVSSCLGEKNQDSQEFEISAPIAKIITSYLKYKLVYK